MYFSKFYFAYSAVGSRIYFGTAFGTYNCTDSTNDACRAYTFNRGIGGIRRAGMPKRLRLRDTAYWRNLSALMHEYLAKRSSDSTDWRREADAYGRLDRQTLSVTYGTGGAYGFSRPAAELLVDSQCMVRLGEVRCHRCARNMRGKTQTWSMHHLEDTNVGLCMHLLNVRLLSCGSFHTMVPSFGYTWPPFELVSRLQPTLQRLRKRNMSYLHHHPWAVPRNVYVKFMHGFYDEKSQTSRLWPQLSAHPIVIHPVKGKHGVGGKMWWQHLWRALELREAYQGGLLRLWRRDGGRASLDPLVEDLGV